MRVTVIAVGRVRGPLAPAVHEFETRAARYWKLEVVEVDGGVGRGDARDPASVRRAEGERLLQRIPKEGEIWALSRTGKAIGSEQLADELRTRMLHAAAGISFLIGGAHGLDDRVFEKANRSLSLSAMTFPHEMARLVLAEQLYRAGTILRGEPYHKGPT
jgi:23S rRNA (pseudouridine1915-N3)-methyltransferase